MDARLNSGGFYAIGVYLVYCIYISDVDLCHGRVDNFVDKHLTDLIQMEGKYETVRYSVLLHHVKNSSIILCCFHQT